MGPGCKYLIYTTAHIELIWWHLKQVLLAGFSENQYQCPLKWQRCYRKLPPYRVSSAANFSLANENSIINIWRGVSKICPCCSENCRSSMKNFHILGFFGFFLNVNSHSTIGWGTDTGHSTHGPPSFPQPTHSRKFNPTRQCPKW